LSAIPIVGPTGWFASYRGRETFKKHADKMVREGAEKYPAGMFRVPRLGWTVIVTGRQLVEELRSAPEDELSFHFSAEESVQVAHTLGPTVTEAKAHVHYNVIRSDLTRNISARFDDIYDEICMAFGDNIQFEDGQEWCTVPAFHATMSIVSRTSNRYFVGLPLCRDQAYLNSISQFAGNVMKAAVKINRWPKALQPHVRNLLVGWVLSPFKMHYPRLAGHIGSLVAQRMREEQALGAERVNKPNDAISWLLKYDHSEERLEATVMRIMTINFVAIHTSTNLFTHSLFWLAAQPEHIGPLRAEVEYVVSRQGWTKAGLQAMHKIDSFLREVGRTTDAGCFVLNRKVTKPGGYTFSDGTTVPQGTHVAAALHPSHLDPAVYADPHVFDGFRYSRLREKEPTKYRLVSTDYNYLQFGYGQHACPGRFFAANELKAMLAHVVLHYDVQLEGGLRVVPPSEWLEEHAWANTSAKVMFRKRVA
ncbi:cytochrome P450, partial [Schizophyllum fasciatum]